MNQPIHVPKMETMPMHALKNENVMEEPPNDLSMQDAEVNMENQPLILNEELRTEEVLDNIRVMSLNEELRTEEALDTQNKR